VRKARGGDGSGGRPEPRSEAGPEPDVAATNAPAMTATMTVDAAPSRDELTIAWGDAVLAVLPLKVRSKWRGGRFIDSDSGAARFAVPNEWHMKECEVGRHDVLAALAAHFGRPVDLELVLDDGSTPVATHETAPSTPAPFDDAVDDESSIDLSELVDAPDVTSGVDKLLEMFPGSELLEEGT
jgi:hypothetical protein